MSKAYAIIEEDDQSKIVVPTKWLSDDFKSISWPPYDTVKLKKAILNLEDVEEDWEVYPVARFVKMKENYIDAVDEIKKNLDELTDGSDLEMLKRSRALRNKRKVDNDLEPVLKKTKISSSESLSNPEDILEATDPLQIEKPPATVSLITGNSDESSKSNGLLDNQQIGSRNGTSDRQIVMRNQNKLNETIDGDSITKPKIINTTDDFNLLDFNGKLAAIFGLQKKFLCDIHVMSRKLDNMNDRLKILETNPVKARNTDRIAITNMMEYFPIDEIAKTVDTLEKKLKERKFFDEVVSYMMSIGGNSPHDLIYNILGATIKDNILQNYSYYGLRKKLKFSELLFCSCIFQAVRSSFEGITDTLIKHSIKMRIDTSTTRVKRSENAIPKRDSFTPVIPLSPTHEEEENFGEHANK